MSRGGEVRTCVEATIRLDSILVGFGRGEAPRDRRGDPSPFDSVGHGPSRRGAVPSLISDAVDAYAVRRLNARLQFLLMQRRADAPFGNSWQAIHARVGPEETAITAAERALAETTGLVARTVYSADYVNQIFDHARDAIVLIPVFAFEVEAQAQVDPGPDFLGYEWCEREEATARLLWAGQRWSVRHIDDVIGGGGPEAEFYRIR
jgi:dihydroneopterin triphosphate diphosphatase